jgi:hypothetical protein
LPGPGSANGAILLQGAATITIADNVVLHGSDGSLGKQHTLFHLTVNANGTVTSSIDTDQLPC